jgi:hypothetical protein
MKRVAILCQTAPEGKRRLAEEALRLVAGLTATGRLRVDLILTSSALLLLQPEMGGPIGSWDSIISPQTRILIPSGTPLPSTPPVSYLPDGDYEKAAVGADLILRF